MRSNCFSPCALPPQLLNKSKILMKSTVGQSVLGHWKLSTAWHAKITATQLPISFLLSTWQAPVIQLKYMSSGNLRGTTECSFWVLWPGLAQLMAVVWEVTQWMDCPHSRPPLPNTTPSLSSLCLSDELISEFFKSTLHTYYQILLMHKGNKYESISMSFLKKES